MTELTEEEKKLIVAALLEYESGPSIEYQQVLQIMKKLGIDESLIKIVDEDGYLDK